MCWCKRGLDTQTKSFFIRLFIFLSIIGITVTVMFCKPVHDWIEDNSSVVNFLCWLIGLGGAYVITNVVRKENLKRQRDARFGFYFNLKTYLERLEKRIPRHNAHKDDPYGYFFINSTDKDKNPYDERSGPILEEMRGFASSFLDFFAHVDNVVSPDIKKTSNWEENLSIIVDFLAKTENIGKLQEGHYEDKSEYVKYKECVLKSITAIKTDLGFKDHSSNVEKNTTLVTSK